MISVSLLGYLDGGRLTVECHYSKIGFQPSISPESGLGSGDPAHATSNKCPRQAQGLKDDSVGRI